MELTVDGYRLWQVRDSIGVPTTIAAVGAVDLIERASLRGLAVDERTIGLHPLYGEHVRAHDIFDKEQILKQLTDTIYRDIADYP